MPSKRKVHPEAEESPAKRPASQSHRGDVSSGEEQEGEEPWERRPGMILEVSMRNFMCHEVRPRSCPDNSLDDLHDVLL